MPDEIREVAEHYAREDLGETILAALRAAGKDVDALTPDDLAPLDQFHVRGLEATEQLAELAALDARTRVLDVGCGIGGPARHLAAKHGCRVTGLDLTEEFCRVASMLAARTGLSERVEFRQGDALDMPFEDASFDVVWTQHASMNIADKDGLLAEMHRVLEPGGRLALYDILAGPGGPPHFPVPWAREPEISFLDAPEALRARLEALGLDILAWRDVTEPVTDWARTTRAKVAEHGPPPLGLHLVMGPDWGEMFGNVGRNLEEGRIAIYQAVARKA
jgi:SAM-dependent methyltransferase